MQASDPGYFIDPVDLLEVFHKFFEDRIVFDHQLDAALESAPVRVKIDVTHVYVHLIRNNLCDGVDQAEMWGAFRVGARG